MTVTGSNYCWHHQTLVGCIRNFAFRWWANQSREMCCVYCTILKMCCVYCTTPKMRCCGQLLNIIIPFFQCKQAVAALSKDSTALSILPRVFAPVVARRSDYEEINVRLERDISTRRGNDIGRKHIKGREYHEWCKIVWTFSSTT